MKLYLSPGACSLADHIALHEAGLDFERVRVDLRTKTDRGRPRLQRDQPQRLRAGPSRFLPEKPELLITENSNLKAMRRIVAQTKDPKEVAERFHQVVRTAIERFNEGHLPQAASMFELQKKSSLLRK